jgi:hypothetical protein
LSISGGTRADQHSLADALRAVTSNVAGNFTAAGGMPDVDHIFQVELLNQHGEIVGIGVHFVAVPRLA